MTGETEILKQDGRGRVLVSRERREALLEEFEKSGLSGVGFARMAGVKYATFASWIAAKKRKRGKRPGKATIDGCKREEPFQTDLQRRGESSSTFETGQFGSFGRTSLR